MSPKTLIATILIGLGIVAFVYQGIDYTTRGKDVSIGPLHMQTEKEHHIPLPPVLGAIALVAGFALLLVDKRGIGRASAS
jgi:hypothetical protein